MITGDVITAVRRRLGDARKERWSDEQLILYTAMCQSDICLFTNFYRLEGEIQLVDGVLVYDLPDDCIKLTRLEYNCAYFPIESRNEIDNHTAIFPCALKDNLALHKLEIVLDDNCTSLETALTGVYGVVANTDASDCELDQAHGVVTDVDCDDCSVCETSLDKLKLYYIGVPPLVINLNDGLLVPDMWLSAFIHYVGGMALQDDNDANNIQRGEMDLQKYQRMLVSIQKLTAKDFTSNVKSKLDTKIRRI